MRGGAGRPRRSWWCRDDFRHRGSRRSLSRQRLHAVRGRYRHPPNPRRMTSLSPAVKSKPVALPMTDEEYAKFCEFFYRKTGIQFVDSKKYYVERRVADRIAKTNSGSFRDYFTLVRFQMSGQEMQSLVNAMTVNETYFFREDYQFDS